MTSSRRLSRTGLKLEMAQQPVGQASSSRAQDDLGRVRGFGTRRLWVSILSLLLVSAVAGALAWTILMKPVLSPDVTRLVGQYPLPLLGGLVALIIFLNGLVLRQTLSLRKRLNELGRELGQRETEEGLAMVDPVTRLFNRRYLDEIVPKEASRAARRGTSLTFVKADLDGFASLIERLGSQTGERVVIEVSELFRNSLRPTDTVVRYDTAEFVIVLPETSKHGALAVVKRLLDKIDQWNRAGSIPGTTLNFSFGLAAYTLGADVTEVLATAIERVTLYRERLP